VLKERRRRFFDNPYYSREGLKYTPLRKVDLGIKITNSISANGGIARNVSSCSPNIYITSHLCIHDNCEWFRKG
jgi:hypothetical protein